MFTLPPLPYAENALEPVITANTLSFHYGKHHKAYVDNLNKLVAGTEYEAAPLEKIIKETAGKADKAGIFNNAAQIWNHTFYWHSMRGNGGGKPSGKLAQMIDADLGGYDTFKKDFAANAVSQFGSGWNWLVKKADGSVDIVNMGAAGTPLTTADKALFTVDVWEHAYYIDHRNLRPKFVETYLNSLANWDFAEANFA